jgi:hypothetical protein
VWNRRRRLLRQRPDCDFVSGGVANAGWRWDDWASHSCFIKLKPAKAKAREWPHAGSSIEDLLRFNTGSWMVNETQHADLPSFQALSSRT